MTKLRSRLLVTLVLAAVVLAAVGIDIAAAGTFQRRLPPLRMSPAVTRAGVGSYAGEPDPTGSGAPSPSVKPASMTYVPGQWLTWLWIQWRTRGQFAQPQLRR